MGAAGGATIQAFHTHSTTKSLLSGPPMRKAVTYVNGFQICTSSASCFPKHRQPTTIFHPKPIPLPGSPASMEALPSSPLNAGQQILLIQAHDSLSNAFSRLWTISQKHPSQAPREEELSKWVFVFVLFCLQQFPLEFRFHTVARLIFMKLSSENLPIQNP